MVDSGPPLQDRSTQLVATLTRPPEQAAAAIERLPESVGWIEVRADLAGDADAFALREASGRRLVYTRRSREEGGDDELSLGERHERLVAAGERYELVDLELERDLVPAVLERIPVGRRLVSWHGDAVSRQELESRLEEMRAVPARLYKVVPSRSEADPSSAATSRVEDGPIRGGSASEPEADLAPLALLAAAGREDVVAFAGGRSGFWTRLLAPRLGAPWVYAALEEDSARIAAPGQPSVRCLVEDYGLPGLPPLEALFGLVGRPALHSLSPRLHNSAYRELGLPFLYVPFEAGRFADFWLHTVEKRELDDLGFPLRGLSVTTPYKETAYAVAGAASPRAHRLEAVNTLVRREGVWEGESTDGDGVTRPLADRGVELASRRAVVVGAGGAGRAAALALANSGAETWLANRTVERGRAAAERLGVSFVPLTELELGSFDIVVNATPLGMEEDDPFPFEIGDLAPEATLVDLVYGTEPTALTSVARERGLAVVDGLEVLRAQARRQFEIMTGRSMPPDEREAPLRTGGEETWHHRLPSTDRR